jgi:hypothetical protein
MNQCIDELQRTSQDETALMTDHFITMSQIQCAYYDEHHSQQKAFVQSLGTGEEID